MVVVLFGPGEKTKKVVVDDVKQATSIAEHCDNMAALVVNGISYLYSSVEKKWRQEEGAQHD